MRKIFFIFFSVICSLHVLAQDTTVNKRIPKRRYYQPNKSQEDGVIYYHKQTAFGLKLNSDGYAVFMEMGRQLTVKKSVLFQLELSERKSAKEYKETNPYVDGAPFIYGKENFFYPIKLGVQEQFLLGNKSNKNGVSVSANFGGGLAIGLLRPYEMQVITDSLGDTKFVSLNPSDSALFFSVGQPGGYDLTTGTLINAVPGFIAGPGFGNGWSNLSVVPGLYVKSGLRFDYGRSNELVSAIEVGLAADYYTKKIPLIAFAPEKQFFLNAYASIIFGKRK